MASISWPVSVPSRWELAAEAVVVKMRWVGVVIGVLLVNLEPQPSANVAILNALLGLGALYALADSVFSYRGRILLGQFPLGIGALEAVFIGLLCYFDQGLDSPFRYYYLLSLICAAIRHDWKITYATCALHCLSCLLVFLSQPPQPQGVRVLLLMLVLLGWATWSANALAELLKQVGDHLHDLNHALQQQQALLEERIAQRSRELEEAQARLLHQEKMAAFGLLAAGIAHEVGNPLTSISSLIQMLQRRIGDAYAQEKLALISGQLQRIQATLRELITFSRPAAKERTWTNPAEIVSEALNIAKYYKRIVGKSITTRIPDALPAVYVVRDQLVQAVLNLVLNAIDATERGGTIEVAAAVDNGELVISVTDDGQGVQDPSKLFRPYYTTKPHGTGLGLFVTRQLVSEHGGRVTFASQPHTATTFRIHLPLG
jgi:two-component system NtrC family sensor kinase